MKDIIKLNVIIAKFMGWKIHVDEGAIQLYERNGIVKHIGQLEYNIDWNLLMSVVEKISNDFKVNKNFHLYIKYLIEDSTDREDFLIYRLSKEETYNAVIEFIEWYNENE